MTISQTSGKKIILCTGGVISDILQSKGAAFGSAGNASGYFDIVGMDFLRTANSP